MNLREIFGRNSYAAACYRTMCRQNIELYRTWSVFIFKLILVFYALWFEFEESVKTIENRDGSISDVSSC